MYLISLQKPHPEIGKTSLWRGKNYSLCSSKGLKQVSDGIAVDVRLQRFPHDGK
jgi:hypothetical protein